MNAIFILRKEFENKFTLNTMGEIDEELMLTAKT